MLKIEMVLFSSICKFHLKMAFILSFFAIKSHVSPILLVYSNIAQNAFIFPVGIFIIIYEISVNHRTNEILKFNLRSNHLAYIPETVRTFKNLVTLDLSDNQITFLPEFLGTEFPNLSVLELRNNLITTADIPKDLSSWKRNLKSLNLSGNRINVIPPQLFELTGKFI